MSLKKSIKKEIQSKFPKVYNSNNNKISNLKYWIFGKNFWHLLLSYIVVIAFVIIYSKFIDFRFLKILEIKFEDNIKTFTTGIITLVSMNLFVTNLLLTHLKDERDDIQSIIDKKVNFKFITYLGFTLIICVLFLYFFSTSVKSENINNNILIFIFSSFIFYIFLLVNLYNTVFNFIHKTKRTEIVKTELNLEFYKAFYIDYYKRRFNEEYKSIMEKKLNFQPYPIWSEIQGINHHTYKPSKNIYLDDINIKAITKLSEELPKKARYYHLIELNKQYKKDEHIKLFSLLENKKFDYNKVYSFSTNNSIQLEYSQEHLDKLLKKINDNTLNNKFSELSINLKSLNDIYTEYIEF